MHSATATADLAPGEVVSVQMAWRRGWRAIVNGRESPVLRDAIGLMYIAPETPGPCRIEMTYDGGAETFIARAACGLVALLLAASSVRAIMSRQ